MTVATAARASGKWGRAPALGLALLPALLPKCPLCLAAHASVLGAARVGDDLSPGAWARPLTVVAVTAVLALLALRARARRGYGPLALAAVGGALILLEAFHRHAPAAAHSHHAAELYPVLLAWTGVGLLLVATTWNAWPRHGVVPPACGHETDATCMLPTKHRVLP